MVKLPFPDFVKDHSKMLALGFDLPSQDLCRRERELEDEDTRILKSFVSKGNSEGINIQNFLFYGIIRASQEKDEEKDFSEKFQK